MLAASSASAVTVDGIISSGEWNGANVVITDSNEAAVSDNYDVQRIMMEDGEHSLYVAVSVYGDHPALAAEGSIRPYLNFYFNLSSGEAAPHRFGLTYNDGYGFPPGSMHLVEYGSGWRDLGAVPFSIGQAVEASIPWTMLPASLTAAGPIAVQGLFFLYNVAPGDANADGQVDIGDLGILNSNYGRIGATWAMGDFNLDGVVDIGDLGILNSHYGYQAAGGTECDMFDAAATVDRNLPLTNHAPEPLTILGIFAGVCGLGGYLRRRKAA
jgi:hypothetical protein